MADDRAGSSDERQKLIKYRLIQLALERYDQVRKLPRFYPAPRPELGIGGFYPNVRIGAEEAGEEPILALAAIAPLSKLADQILGQIVKQLLS